MSRLIAVLSAVLVLACGRDAEPQGSDGSAAKRLALP